MQKGNLEMYSDEQCRKTLEVYEETKLVTKTMMILGYPARRQTIYNWIHRKRILPEGRSTFRYYNTKGHPRHHSLEQKLQILHTMLDRAIRSLPKDAHPILHSDRGYHY